MILVFPFTFLKGYLHPFKFEFSWWPWLSNGYFELSTYEYDMVDLCEHISLDIIICFIFMLFCLYPIQSLIVTAILIALLFLLMCSNKYCTIKKYESNENKDN